MIEEIEFLDSDNKVSITIDNETQTIPIKTIKKLSTYIELNQSLDTALNNNIEVDAYIYYIKNNNNEESYTEVAEEREFIYTEGIEEGEEDDERKDIRFLTNTEISYSRINIDGTVTITIFDDNKIYYVKDVYFSKGHIVDSINNTLPVGNYKMKIQYAGNKYLEPSQEFIAYFDVDKRLAICDFNTNTFYGDLTETLNITGTLKDNEKNTIIKNCQLYYDFNGETRTTTTDIEGKFNLIINIPDADISHCNLLYEDIDESMFEAGDPYEEDAEEEIRNNENEIQLLSDLEDTNIENEDVDEYDDNIDNTNYNYQDYIEIKEYYPNASYIVEIYTDNDSYYVNDKSIEIILNKAPTHIIIDSLNSNENSNILQVVGSGIATYNESDNDIKYGEINISLPDLKYKHHAINIDDNGIFATDIDLVEVFSEYNFNENTNIEVYDTTQIYSIGITVDSNKNINAGDMLTVKAQVKSSGKDVKYGILVFNLYHDNEIIHRYSTEISSTGEGIFNFDTSTPGSYKVDVEYVGMFGYQDAKSEKYDITVI